MTISYIPVRNYTVFSLLEGALHIPKLVAFAQKHHIPALGIADYANLFGAHLFSCTCLKAGIQPILGSVIPIVPPYGDIPLEVTLYAINQSGYRNLCALLMHCTLVNKGYAAPIALDTLVLHQEGLMFLDGGENGPFQRYAQHAELVQNIFSTLSSAFNRDRLYIEIQRPSGHKSSTEDFIIDFAARHGLPVLATHRAFYEENSFAEAHEILQCISAGTTLFDPNRPKAHSSAFLQKPDDMQAIFSDIPEALENTRFFAQRCHFVLQNIKPSLPTYPSEKPEKEVLLELASEGLNQRLQHLNLNQSQKENYTKRLLHECQVINDMDFAGYFLIVSDFIRWAKNHDIAVGPGRGSGASSLTAWALQITDVDPIRFSLLFERFLNPMRVSMPDFDVDFCQERRDEVIAYLCQRYGKDRVAHIITFGSLAARAVLRDVGRVLGLPYMQVDRICKMVPSNPANPVSLSQAIEGDVQFKVLADEEPAIGRMLEIGQKLEGLYRHASIHAAGIVIGRTSLLQTVPLCHDARWPMPATQYSMKYVEGAGLVKFDFLGLKTLTIIQKTINILREQDITLTLEHIPWNDSVTFDMLRRVETVGVFQLESAGMKDVLRQLQPQAFEELIALIALYRPGPMDSIPRYISCRHGREEVQYPYECLGPILCETFGVMVYQEQVLQIAQILAGLTLADADLLRRAMGKKIKSEMDEQKSKFVEGVLRLHQGSSAKAEDLFEQIAKFAGYAFPKAHAAPYALITYRTAYLKANFPVAFMCALINADIHQSDKLMGFVAEIKRLKIPLFPPCVNHSDVLFTVQSAKSAGSWNAIRYGLAALKNVGIGAMENVVSERNANGVFTSIWNFFERTAPFINRRHLESLIEAGALDALNNNRASLWASLDILLKHGTSHAKQSSTNLLFSNDILRPEIMEVQPWNVNERQQHEFHAVGFYLHAHPLDIDQDILIEQGIVPVIRLKNTMSLPKTVALAGVVMSVIESLNKKNQKNAILQMSDSTGNFEVYVFARILEEMRQYCHVGHKLILHVAIQGEGDNMRLSANRLQLFSPQVQDRLYIFISNPIHATFQQLKQILDEKSATGTGVLYMVVACAQDAMQHVYLRMSKTLHIEYTLKISILSVSGVKLYKKWPEISE